MIFARIVNESKMNYSIFFSFFRSFFWLVTSSSLQSDFGFIVDTAEDRSDEIEQFWEILKFLDLNKIIWTF
jgi:hypothetical protein